MNILLVQDHPSDARLIQASIDGSPEGKFKVEWVTSCADGVRRLAESTASPQAATAISAALVDLMLADSQGVPTFDRLFEVAPQIPILILTAAEGEADAKTAVQRGAQDYLFKARLDSYLLPKTVASMVERAVNAEILFLEQERARVTLDSIGDAVVSIDVHGSVTYLNAVAEVMSGWSKEEAQGRPVGEVIRIIDLNNRLPMRNPMIVAMDENRTVALTRDCLLVRRDGEESAIEDSAAPIHDRRGLVTGAVMVFHDVSISRALSSRMSHLAQHDSLTDLPNRLLLNDRLVEAMRLAHRHGRSLAVLFLDVDRFKHVNDSLGHETGDQLLQAIADRLVGSVRESDTVSRQGGDEFVILLSEVAHPHDAGACAEKILAAAGEPYRINGRDIHVSVSVGIATFPEDGTTPETLIQSADFAMYHAKESGRGNFQYFKPDMNHRALERQSLEDGLRDALQREQFVLHYQPKVDLESRSIVGVEALIRWRHPQRGLVPPTQFIPVAEDCGFISSIGHWVLREACRQAVAWKRAGVRSIPVAVNISAAELRSREFVSGVRSVFSETGLDPDCIEFELTESFLMQDDRSTSTVLHALKDMGHRLALDDFGTGYSSLSYLKRYPIDTLKIDQSFVRDVTTDADDASIVSAVISMGESLHMSVVAEGVETAEQLAFLSERRCPEAQGFLFSKPLPPADVARLFGRRCPAPRVAGLHVV